MKKYLILYIGIITQFFWGCNENTAFEPGSEQIVIRGYLYANEPVTDIQISKALYLGSTDTILPPINDAEVYLTKNGIKYYLKKSAGDSGYYHYGRNDLSVSTGDQFELSVLYQGKISSAVTLVPEPPDSPVFSADTLFIQQITGSGNPPMGDLRSDTANIKVTWNKSDLNLYYIVIDNVEENPESISSWMPPGMQPGMGRQFISAPQDNSTYRINRTNVTYYGKHRIRIYSVNQEYADLFASRTQNSRDLNEPLTNIKNGLGIFSAFNSVELYFYVVKKE